MGFEVANAYGCVAHWCGVDLRGSRHPGHLPHVAEWRLSVVEIYYAWRVWASELNEAAIEWIELVERTYGFFVSIMSLRRWGLLILGMVLLIRGWVREGADGSDISSVGPRSEGSSASEGERTTAAVSVALQPVEMMCANTNAVLADFMAANCAMMEDINDMGMAQRAGELRRDTLTSGVAGGIQDNRLELKKLFERLDAFEKVLRADAHGSKDTIEATAARSSSVGAAPQSGPISTPVPTPSPELIVTDGVKSDSIRDAVAKMKLKAMLPQQMFLQQLEDYREVDPLVWNAQFSPGFRERVAPSFLSEVFSSGKKLESNGRATSSGVTLWWIVARPESWWPRSRLSIS